MLTRPLPPFRARPAPKPLVHKARGEIPKEAHGVSVRARRLPIRVARLAPPPALKVLSRAADQA